MNNLADCYTEQDAAMVLYRSPVPYRAGLNAIVWANMWLYPRLETDRLGRVLNAGDPLVLELIDHSHLIAKMDLWLDEWVSLTDALDRIAISKERLYQITKRSKSPKIPYHVINNKMVFSVGGLERYATKRSD